MHERKCNLTFALEWISELHDRLVETFLSTLKTVPSFDNLTLDKQVSTYVDGLGNWVRANDTWSFEVRGLLTLSGYVFDQKFQSERYFGRRGLEIQEKRLVNLLPKEVGESTYQYVNPATFQHKSPLQSLSPALRDTLQVSLFAIMCSLLGLCLVIASPFSAASVLPSQS